MVSSTNNSQLHNLNDLTFWSEIHKLHFESRTSGVWSHSIYFYVTCFLEEHCLFQTSRPHCYFMYWLVKYSLTITLHSKYRFTDCPRHLTPINQHLSFCYSCQVFWLRELPVHSTPLMLALMSDRHTGAYHKRKNRSSLGSLPRLNS